MTSMYWAIQADDEVLLSRDGLPLLFWAYDHAMSYLRVNRLNESWHPVQIKLVVKRGKR